MQVLVTMGMRSRSPPLVLIWLAIVSSPASSLSGWGGVFSRGDGPGDVDIQLPLKRTEQGWYTVELQLAGSPTRLLVDTGSSTLWARTPSVAKVAARSSKSPLGNFSAQYGRGAVSGEVIETTVLLSSVAAAKPRSCHVGLPLDEGTFWARQHSINGVLGLGCSGEGAVADALTCVVPSPPQTLLLLGPRKRRIFCLQMTPTGGMLTLGSVPQAVQLMNLISMPPAADCGHWTVPLVSLSMRSNKDSSGDQKIASNAEAILDSGSDGVIGPTFAVIDLARRLGASPAKSGEGYGGEVTFYQVPCDSAESLPPVLLVLGDVHGVTTSITLRGSDLVAAGKDGEDTCHLRVVGWETQSWILGAVFLSRLQAVTFDVDNGVVAIVPPAT